MLITPQKVVHDHPRQSRVAASVHRQCFANSSSNSPRKQHLGTHMLRARPRAADKTGWQTEAVSSGQQSAAIEGNDDHQAFMQDMINFLWEDWRHLFDERGQDPSRYDVVDFMDPINRVKSKWIYHYGIRLLRYLFAPTFIVHDIKQTDAWELSARWTMVMRFTPVLFLKPLFRYWQPILVFTGISIMGISPQTKKFNRHTDQWDSLRQQQFYSLEGLFNVLQQLFNFTRTPLVDTPTFVVMRKCKEYEVRRYEPFSAVTTPLQAATSASSDTFLAAFRALSGYLTSSNGKHVKMDMTAPVLTKDGAAMYVMLPSSVKDTADLPPPSDPNIRVEEVPGGMLAAVVFNGTADEKAVQHNLQQLRALLDRDGYSYSDSYWVACYNQPSVPPPVRRNEVLVEVHNFDVWRSPPTLARE